MPMNSKKKYHVDTAHYLAPAMGAGFMAGELMNWLHVYAPYNWILVFSATFAMGYWAYRTEKKRQLNDE